VEGGQIRNLLSVADGPNLVHVIVSALPGLHPVGVGQASISEIETEALVGQSDPLVGGVEPILSWQVAEAFPDLHSDTIGRS